MRDQYETVQHRWFEEVWNKGRAEAIDEMLDPNIIGHGLTDSSGNEVRGAKAFRKFYEGFRGAFPDIRITVEETVTEGDRIVARCTARGTHSGEGIGLSPTNKPVEFTGLCLVRVKDGKIVESWNSFDFLTLFQQIGAVSLSTK
jgi:predicted ester cyclase